MCRMIVAQGRFSSTRVLEAAITMSCGRSADHEGPIREHPNGWGAIWRDPEGRVAIHRDTRTIEASAEPSPLPAMDGGFLAVHVRHATLARNAGLACTHPVVRETAAGTWHLLHNGFLPTVYQHLGKAQSEFDSAEYLEYLVADAGAELDCAVVAERLRAIPPGGSSANAILVGPTRAYVIHWTPEDNPYPRYFTMHRLVTEAGTIIASEIVPALAPPAHWRALPARSIEPL